jgi:hypothetical protein
MFNRRINNSQMLLDFLDNNSGILVGQGSGYFRFIHRSFQESLAAGYLSRQRDGISVTLQVLYQIIECFDKVLRPFTQC